MANTTQRRSSVRKYTILALVVFALIAVIGGTYSRYSSTGTANATVGVAQWAVQLNGTDISSASAVVTPSLTYAANDNVAANKLAPGRTATFDVELDPTGSEVAIDYTLKINTASITGITNASSAISVSGAKYWVGTITGEGTNAAITSTDGVTISESLADVQKKKKVTVRVTVTWDNAADANSVADTANGVTAADITIPVNVTAKQHI